jgi:large subunit ribosomal protein L6
MSRLGKQPILLPSGVTLKMSEDSIIIEGPKGKITVPKMDGISVSVSDNIVTVAPENQIKQTQMNWGTLWSHMTNAVLGVTEGFSKTLEIEGVGFKVSLEGKELVLKVGFSHLVRFPIPEGINITVEKNKIVVSGIEKQKVGHVAASIRKIKKPEPYLGKGIHYEKEIIRRKAGKKAGATTTK